MDDVTLTRIEPRATDIKRYAVSVGGEAKGYVIQWMSQIDIPIRGARYVKRGKRRPFWTFAGLDKQTNYRVKLETRADAVRWLVG